MRLGLLLLAAGAGALLSGPSSKGNEYEELQWWAPPLRKVTGADCNSQGRMVKKNHGNHLAVVRPLPETRSVWVNPGFQSRWVEAWSERGAVRNVCGGVLLGRVSTGCYPVDAFGPPFRCLRYKKRRSFTGQ